jgi:hypothetical protein
MDFPLFDAIVLGNKNAVMNILNLSGPNGSGYLSGPNEMMNNNRNGNILRTMKDDMGRTPLHWAASNQYSEKLVPLLIELGASIHSTDCLGNANNVFLYIILNLSIICLNFERV